MNQENDEEIRNFDEKFYKEIFDKKDLANRGILSTELLIESLANEKVNEIAEILKSIAVDRNRNEFTKEEFLAFCYWQSKINNLVSLYESQKSQPPKLDEIMKKLLELGFYTSIEEVETHVKNFKKCNHQKSNTQCKLCIQRYHEKSIKDMVSEFHRVMVDTGNEAIIPVKKDNPQIRMSKNIAKQLLAGGVAGIVSRSVTAPIDRIKVLMQVQAFRENKPTIKNICEKIYSDGGYFGFWRGNGVNCVKVGPESAFRFAFYDFFKQLLHKDKEHSTLFDKFICGSLAGTTSQFITYPLEVMKTRIAVSNYNQYSGIFDTFYKISTKEGYASLYRGIIPCLVGAFPYSGINLSVYEVISGFFVLFDIITKSIKFAYKKYYLPHKPDQALSIGAIFLASSLANCVAQFSTYPLVVVRTNMQVYQRPGKLNIPHDLRYMSKLCRDIYRTNGVWGFYSGFGPNFIKVLPSVTLSFIIYEKVLSFLKN